MNQLKNSYNIKKLEFYGGPGLSFLPLFIFLCLTIINTFYYKSISDGALWIPAFFSIVIPFFFAKNKKHYTECMLKGTANVNVMIPIVAWIFSGVFSNILKASGLAEGIAGVAASIGIKGNFFIIIAFLASAVFSTSTGTGFGTITMGMGVLYPAGVALGSHPALLAGSIISAGAFGDNLSPISDTTISSAATLGVDVTGAVKYRLSYSLLALVLTIVSIFIIGSGYKSNIIPVVPVSTFNAKTLYMLIPVIITIYIAIKTEDIVISTIMGSVLSCIYAVGFDLIKLVSIYETNIEKDALLKVSKVNEFIVIEGVIYEGIESMIQVIILALLLFGILEIIKSSGGNEIFLSFLDKKIKGKIGAEIITSILVIVLSGIIGLNAPAILVVGSYLAKPLAERQSINPYRLSSILCSQGNTMVYSMPWTPALVYTASISTDSQYPLTAYDIVPYVTFTYILMILTFIIIIFQIDSRFYLKKSIDRQGDSYENKNYKN